MLESSIMQAKIRARFQWLAGAAFALILLMFAGRLGPLTLAYLIATPKKSRLKHPPADIQIG